VPIIVFPKVWSEPHRLFNTVEITPLPSDGERGHPMNCSCCGSALLTYLEDVDTLCMCPNCGHLVYFDPELGIRDINTEELALPCNQLILKFAQEKQQDYCHKKGWWG
jgi:hypothetical protein